MKKSAREKNIAVRILMILVWSFVAFILFTMGSLVSVPFNLLWNLLVIPNVADGMGVFETATTYYKFIGIDIFLILFMLIVKPFRPILKSLGSKAKGNNWKMALVGLAIGLGMNLFVAIVAIIHGDIQLSFYNFNIGAFILLLVVVAIQCAAEEIAYRGFLLQMTAKYFKSPIIIIALNSIMFSLNHIANPGVTFNALLDIFILGVLLSIMVYYFDSFWAAVGIHTAWNFCQSILLGLPNSGLVFPYSIFKLDAASATNSFCYNVNFGIEGTVLAIITGTIAIAVTCYIGNKKQVRMADVWEVEQVEVVEETKTEEIQ